MVTLRVRFRMRLHGTRAKRKDPSGHNGYQYLLSFQLLKVRLMSGERTELINGGTSVHSVQGPCVCLYSLSPPKTTRMMGGVSCFKSIWMMRRPQPPLLLVSSIHIQLLHLYPSNSVLVHPIWNFLWSSPPPLCSCFHNKPRWVFTRPRFWWLMVVVSIL